MFSSYLSSDTHTLVLEDSQRAKHYQKEFQLSHFADLQWQTRDAAFTRAVEAATKKETPSACITVITPATIYSAVRGQSELYLVVMDTKDELLHFSEITQDPEGESKADATQPVALTDEHGKIIAEQHLLKSGAMTMKKTVLMLPAGASAYVLHDFNNVLARLPLDKFELHLAKGELAVKKLSKRSQVAACRSNSYFMLTPVEMVPRPKCLYFSQSSERSRQFEVLFTQTIRVLSWQLQDNQRTDKLRSVQLAQQESQLRSLLAILKKEAPEFPRLASYPAAINVLLQDVRILSWEKRADVILFNQAYLKLLFGIYIDFYKFYPKSTAFFSPGKVRTNAFLNYLEEVLQWACPDINENAIHKTLKSSILANRILWCAGKKYPEFVDATTQFIEHLPEEKATPEEARQHFLQAGKLLVRLGSDGFLKSQFLFSHDNTETRVTKKELEAYYDKHISGTPKPG